VCKASVSAKKREVTTTQFLRRLIKENAEVRQSQGSVPPFLHQSLQHIYVYIASCYRAIVLSCYGVKSPQRYLARLPESAHYKTDTILLCSMSVTPSNLGFVVLGGDFNAHVGNLEDTPVEQLDWQLPARVPVTLDGNVAEVHDAAGKLLIDTCIACCVGVVTAPLQAGYRFRYVLQPGIPPCTSFTHRITQTAGRSRPDHFVCSHQLLTSITTSDVMHNVGGSDHLPVSLHMKLPTSTQHPHQSLLRCPPVLTWRGPATLYCSNVQQAITNGSMKAALDLLPEQGLVSSYRSTVGSNKAVSAFSGTAAAVQRCCPQPPRRFSAPWFVGRLGTTA
jgi:hypothetical protein